MKAERQKKISSLLAQVEVLIRQGDFQLEFFEALRDQFRRRFDLTDKQLECLERMRDRVCA